MVTHALSDFKVQTEKPLNVHFVSTMDGSQLSESYIDYAQKQHYLLFPLSHLVRLTRYQMHIQLVSGWKKHLGKVLEC